MSRQSCTDGHHTNMTSSLLLLLPLLISPVVSIRPYVTCVGCDTFLQCFLTCPVADYPGVNKFGVYIPKFLRDLGNSTTETQRACFSLDSSLRRNYQESDHNTYKHWRAYDPKQYKDYYQQLRRRRRSYQDWLSK